jgi:hypothetical protein
VVWQKSGGLDPSARHPSQFSAPAPDVVCLTTSPSTRAHALEDGDGGGPELAYVKMSRAKEGSTLYAVADSLEQAGGG